MEQTNEGIQTGQPGQVAPSSPAPKAQEIPAGSTQQTAPVTQDAETVAAAEAIRRRQQSESDRETAKIANAIRTLKSQGITVSAEQVMSLLHADSTQLPGNVSGQPVQQVAQPNAQPVTQEQPSDPVIRKAFQIMEKEGGKQLEQTDPEFKMINGETDDPEEFLKSVHEAAQAYAKRTGNLSNPARIPILAGGASPNTPNYANVPGVDILEDWNKNHPL